MKMKRFFAAALALLCLCGCNSTSGNTESTASSADTTVAEETVSSESAASDVDSTDEENSSSELQGVFDKISESVELPEMVTLNDNLLNRYYGLSTDSVADYAGGVDGSGVGQDEIALFKAADESQVSVIADALQTRYDSKLSQQENYNPDEAEKIRACQVETNGLYVFLIISNDADEIREIVNSSIQ